MPNTDLINKSYVVNSDSARKYLGDKITGNNLTTVKSRLEGKGELTPEEQDALDWVTKKYEQTRKTIDGVKRTQMKTGRENTYKKTHEKDVDNTNPDKIGGLPNFKTTGDNKHVAGGKTVDQIENNRVQYYESIQSEIDEMKYLIEYMNNNKQKI